MHKPQELAVARCLNSESQLPVATGIAFQQQGLSFAAIDTYAKLVVLLVKVSWVLPWILLLVHFSSWLVSLNVWNIIMQYYGVDPSMAKINLLNKVRCFSLLGMFSWNDWLRWFFELWYRFFQSLYVSSRKLLMRRKQASIPVRISVCL